MRINKQHRIDILSHLMTTLVQSRVPVYETKAKAFLLRMYTLWYAKEIEPYKKHQLYRFLPRVHTVRIIDLRDKKHLSFPLPTKNGGYDSIGDHKGRDLFYDTYSAYSSNSWDRRECPFVVPEKDRAEYDKTVLELRELRSTFNKHLESVEKALAAFNTFNQVEKHAPQLLDVIPEYIRDGIIEYKRTQEQRKGMRRKIVAPGNSTDLTQASHDFAIAKLLKDD